MSVCREPSGSLCDRCYLSVRNIVCSFCLFLASVGGVYLSFEGEHMTFMQPGSDDDQKQLTMAS